MQRQELELQRKELELQRQETARLADESRRQADAIGLTESHTRRDSFIHLFEFIASQLHEIVLALLDRVVKEEHLRDTRLRYSQGQRDAYARHLLSAIIHGNHSNFLETMNKYADRLTLVVRYCELFDMLLNRASDLGKEEGFSDALNCTTYGQLNEIFGSILQLNQGVPLDVIQHQVRDSSN